jgi:hypothetical protein
MGENCYLTTFHMNTLNKYNNNTFKLNRLNEFNDLILL